MLCICAEYPSHVVDNAFDCNDIYSMLGRFILSHSQKILLLHFWLTLVFKVFAGGIRVKDITFGCS